MVGNDLREIIMQSVTTCDNLSGYCRTGGYVDAKKALEVASFIENNYKGGNN